MIAGQTLLMANEPSCRLQTSVLVRTWQNAQHFSVLVAKPLSIQSLSEDISRATQQVSRRSEQTLVADLRPQLQLPNCNSSTGAETSRCGGFASAVVFIERPTVSNTFSQTFSVLVLDG